MKLNLYFFDKKTAIKHALDENNFDEVKNILMKLKRKRGRQPKPKGEIQNACKELPMKKITNEKRMQQLENIEISNNEQNNNKEIMSFYENLTKSDIDWKSINPEQIFLFYLNDQKLRKQNGEVKENEMNNDEVNNNEMYNDEMNNDEMYNNEMQDEEYSSNEYSTDEDSEEEDDLNDDLARDNLKSLSPFKDPSDVYTQIYKVNKKYRIKQVQSSDPKSVLFRCSEKGCFYQVICVHRDDDFYITHQSVHTCSSTDEIKKKKS